MQDMKALFIPHECDIICTVSHKHNLQPEASTLNPQVMQLKIPPTIYSESLLCQRYIITNQMKLVFFWEKKRANSFNLWITLDLNLKMRVRKLEKKLRQYVSIVQLKSDK